MTAWALRTFFMDCAFELRGSGKHLCDQMICRTTFPLGRSELAELRLLATRSVRE
jgi:hypothetical protein